MKRPDSTTPAFTQRALLARAGTMVIGLACLFSTGIVSKLHGFNIFSGGGCGLCLSGFSLITRGLSSLSADEVVT